MNDRLPLHNDEVICLTGPSFDPGELYRAIAPLGLEAHLTTRFALAEQEVKRLVSENGVSYVWRLVRLQAAVMPPTKSVPTLIVLLGAMIGRLAPTEDFIIVDRFLLPMRRSSDYFDLLCTALEPIVHQVRLLTLVTGKEHDPDLLAILRERLAHERTRAKIVHHVSEKFHDRFWIADRSRGLFVGTSFNGIGVRYALVDYMEASDVADIVAALAMELCVV
jgi:hypothetical protein